MKKHSTLWTVVFVLFAVEVFSLLPSKKNVPKLESPLNSKSVQGIIHVHSIYSDGGGTPEEIVQAAQQAGHDFVILTDHNNQTARKEGFEKNYGGTDLFVEMEASVPIGHAVSFFSRNEKLKNADNQTIVNASYEQSLKKEDYPGAFISIAHPTNMKNPWSRLDQFAAGWEVVNFDSSWQRQLAENPFDFLLTVSLYPLNQYLTALRFFATYAKDFVAWDEMTLSGPGHFAYLAHDTHSKVKLNRDSSWNWPGYLQTFKMASNVIFLKEAKANDFETRKKQMYESLKEGRLAIVYQSLAPFEGNDWQVVCGQEHYGIGDTAKNNENCVAQISTPTTSFVKVVRLIKNGQIFREIVVDKKSDKPLQIPLKGPGTYRVEVLAKKHTALRLLLNRLVPYVFYNPIYLQ